MPTGLVQLLRSVGAETVAVCGFCLDFCVAESAIGLRAAGIPDVVVLTDLTAAILRDKEPETIDYLQSQGIRCLTLAEFIKSRGPLGTRETSCAYTLFLYEDAYGQHLMTILRRHRYCRFLCMRAEAPALSCARASAIRFAVYNRLLLLLFSGDLLAKLYAGRKLFITLLDTKAVSHSCLLA